MAEDVVGPDAQAKSAALKPGEILDFPVSVASTAERARAGSQPLAFSLRGIDDPSLAVGSTSTFVSPAR